MYNEALLNNTPDRDCLYRYLEFVRENQEPNDDNLVVMDNKRIYNLTNVYNYEFSAFELERIRSMTITLSHKDIEHYLKPGFDNDVLPLIAIDSKHQWEQDYYRPDSYDDSIQLADRKVKLHTHLNKRIADHDFAEEIFQNITRQVEDYTVRSATEMNEMMELAVQNTDAGKYDNITQVEALVLPPKPHHPPQHYDALPPKHETYSPSIYLLVPISIAAYMLFFVAKSFYRQSSRLGLFGNSESMERSNLIAGSTVELDVSEDESPTVSTPTPTSRFTR